MKQKPHAKVRRRVVVPNVRIAKGIVQKVIFVLNKARHRYIVKSRGFPPIRIDFDEDKGKFHARTGAVDIPAPRADVAFAKAVRQVWALG